MADSKATKKACCLSRCQSRYCEFCYWRESRRIRKKYLNRLLKYVDDGFRLATLTLTVPNLATIKGQDYDCLLQNLKKLFHQDSLMRSIYGGIAKVETKFNSSRAAFHPHIHSIIVYSACIPQDELKQKWAILTNNNSNDELLDAPLTETNRSIWIKKIDFNRDNPASIRLAVRRAINYMCKFNPIDDPEAFASFYCATKGKRLIRAYGGLHRRFNRPLLS